MTYRIERSQPNGFKKAFDILNQTDAAYQLEQINDRWYIQTNDVGLPFQLGFTVKLIEIKEPLPDEIRRCFLL